MSAPRSEDVPSTRERRELLANLLHQRARWAEVYPLSYGQQALWMLHRLAPQSPAYNIQYAARVHPEPDPTMLERALQALAIRHPALRASVFQKDDGEPAQRLLATSKVDFAVLDAAFASVEDLRTALDAASDEPFDLTSGCLLRARLYPAAPGGSVLLLVTHHLAVDFWSLEILVRDLCALYATHVAGGEPTPQLHTTYSDFVWWQQRLLDGPDGERLWRFWQHELAGESPVLALRTDRPRSSPPALDGRTYRCDVDAQLIQRLRTAAQEEGCTLYQLFAAALFLLLFRYTGQVDIAIGTPTAGRSRAEFESVVGYFVNPVVLRQQLAECLTVHDLLQRVRQTALAALEHQDYPFALLFERLHPARDPLISPLFQAEFVWDRSRGLVHGGPALTLETVAAAQRGAPFDLTLRIFEIADDLEATWQYSAGLFDLDTIARMATHFVAALQTFAGDRGRRLVDVPLLTPEERQRQLVEWNATTVEYVDGASTLAQCIEAQVRRTPDATAVIFGEHTISYADLNCRANRLARRLRQVGVGPDAIVGVFMERSTEMVVSLLAILKAGGAYLPLEPEYPTPRIGQLLEDSAARLVLTQERLRAVLSRYAGAVTCVDSEWPAIQDEEPGDLPHWTTQRNLAYLIYTSGSTGAPKGVMVPHEGIVNRLLWMQNEYRLESSDRVLQKTPFSFDVSVWEFFWPLMTGASLVVAPQGLHRDVAALAEFIADAGITVTHFVPSLLALFLAEERAARCTSLKRVICSGEALPTSLVQQFVSRFDAELDNLYGPTEASIDATAWPCQLENPWPTTPIGYPIANTQIYVLDPSLEPTPIGVIGEVYLGGRGLARGYCGRPGLTAERFLPDPFTMSAGARLYRTGDLGSYLSDGGIAFHGRIDQQVKIHGNRVELGEIEVALARHPGVADCAVMASPGPDGAPRLIAHVVPKPGAALTASAVRGFLRQILPVFMIPSHVILQSGLPHNVSGKLDRAAIRKLPTQDFPAQDLSARDATRTPQTTTEHTLLRIWREVLGGHVVDAGDDFFDLGGASIQAIQVAHRAQQEGLPVTPELLFRHRTVAQLAAGLQTATAPFTTGNTVIESIGVYLPSKSVSTAEVLAGCRGGVSFPLERFTGIYSRRAVGPDEFSIDLARKAVSECLASSRYGPDDIDLVVCSSISRADGSPHQFAFEPSMAARLRKDLGFRHALAFDIASACTGMFTGIYVAEALIKTGRVRRAIVVSGEYITHLTRSAQLEIEDFLDSRLACLTLGDAGAALILDGSNQANVGFHHLDMFTLGDYSLYCIAKASQNDHGGAIMYTDSVRLTEVAVSEAARYALAEIARAGWPVDSFAQLILHQTSSTSLRDARREINSLIGSELCHNDNTVDNLAERGNTASTAHFVALMDLIRDDRVQSGDRLVFGISGSGQTLGVGLYVLDDLPDRVRRWVNQGRPADKRAPDPGLIRGATDVPGERPGLPGRTHEPGRRTGSARVRVTAIGTASADEDRIGSRHLARLAAERCVESSGVAKNDIGLLIHAGVYRDEFLIEPALATLLAGELGVNASRGAWRHQKTLAFDVFDGALGFLDACQVAASVILAGRCDNALIVASEIENNRDVPGEPLVGVAEVGGAVLLSKDAAGAGGFGQFQFHYDDARQSVYSVSSKWKPTGRYLEIDRRPGLDAYWVEAVAAVVSDLLSEEGLALSDFRVIIPPQISREFITQLSTALGIERERMVDVTDPQGDLFTSSIPYALQFARDRMTEPGDLGLIIAAGSGLGAGCVVYRF